MVFFGGNYSQFRTTNGVAKSGMNFGYYRQSHLCKQLSLAYGIMYTKKRIDLLDKKIRWSYEYEYSDGADIHLNYNILEFNVLGSYAFQLNENVFISTVIGVGYAIFFRARSDIDASDVIMQNDPVEDYDYACAFTDLGPAIMLNSGWIKHLGIKVSMNRCYGMLIYTNYNKRLGAAGTTDLKLGEKIHSFNVVVGIYL